MEGMDIGACSRRGHARFRRYKVTEATCDPLDNVSVSPMKSDSFHDNMLISNNPHLVQLQPFDLNAEPAHDLMCLDLSLSNVEPGSSSKMSVVGLGLSSNQKPSTPPSIFLHQNNLNVGHQYGSRCLDSSSNQNMSKKFVSVPVSNRGKPPLYPSQYQPQYQQQHSHYASQYNPISSGVSSDPRSSGLKGGMLMCSGFGSSEAPRSSCYDYCCVNKRVNSKFRKTITIPWNISGRLSEIPQDAYSWRKYGQKPIKNSKYPRGYYKCSLSKEYCPAKKYVERCNNDPAKLRITYQNNHNHP